MNEAEAIGTFILDNLGKLMSGEHMGRSVICPIRVKGSDGICQVTIDMPQLVSTRRIIDDDGCMHTAWDHYTWVPDSQVYVLDDFVYREKKSARRSLKK